MVGTVVWSCKDCMIGQQHTLLVGYCDRHNKNNHKYISWEFRNYAKYKDIHIFVGNRPTK